MVNDQENKIVLPSNELPRSWYNILPDLPEALPPPLNPATGEPLNPSALERIFAKECIRQEIASDRYIDIPSEVAEVYMMLGRPSPIFRAKRLEKVLGTPAEIYFKREDLSPVGSHKPNTAVAQAYYLAKEGIEKVTTETGAGQWGSALALACSLFSLETLIFMTRSSYNQKPYRRVVMELFGAKVHPSPSDQTEVGRKFLSENREHPGSLGIAISEALEVALGQDRTKYSLGSVLNHVLLHQTIVGLEAKKQMEMIEKYPDVVVGCIGGGSNFAGISYPFVHDKIKYGKETRFIAVEPKAVPSTTRGLYTYDFGDTAEITPLIKMFTLGHRFAPSPIHAGGLRYHGKAPSMSLLIKNKIIDSVAYHQTEIMDAAVLFARSEGIIPAPETAHAIKAVVDLAIESKRKQDKKIILFNLSGHGLLDLKAYDDLNNSQLIDYEPSEELIQKSLMSIPKVS
ncbi:MAG: TrpB-like pyridoxal phosphate-dependent enzyme [Nitrososphaeria archaeon]